MSEVKLKGMDGVIIGEPEVHICIEVPNESEGIFEESYKELHFFGWEEWEAERIVDILKMRKYTHYTIALKRK